MSFLLRLIRPPTRSRLDRYIAHDRLTRWGRFFRLVLRRAPR